MFPVRSRRSLAIFAAVSATAFAALSGAPSAYASHAGDGTGSITAALSGEGVQYGDWLHLPIAATPDYVSWAPDGSRAVYVSGRDVLTSRWDATAANAGRTYRLVPTAPAGAERAHATWRGSNGFGIAWAERASSSSAWRIMTASASPYCCLQSPLRNDFDAYDAWELTAESGYDYTHPDANDGDLVVFQRQSRTPGSIPEVWLYDPHANPTTRLVVTNAAEPSISPDGTKVAFVRPAGTGNFRHVFTTDINGGGLIQVTTTGVIPVEGPQDDHRYSPVWSPDGTKLAYRKENFGVQVVTATYNATPTWANVAGNPAYRTEKKNTVARLASSSRFGTAAAVSQYRWATAGDGADTRQDAVSVVLSRSDTFADALGGGPLAAAKQGPLLLTPPTSLDPTTATEIDRVLDPGATVYILGSSSAISTAVQDQITAKGYNVVRLSGANRYETAVKIANAIDPNPAIVLTATGINFPDALAAGAAAGSYNYPGSTEHAVVILTNGASMPGASDNYLNGWVANHSGAPFWTLGKQAATAAQYYDRYVLAGVDRYQTSALAAYYFFGSMQVAGVATGTNWPDALSGGALLASLNGPLLLTPSTGGLNGYSTGMLDMNSGTISTALIFGSSGAVTTEVDTQIGGWISGPASYDLIGFDESGPIVTTLGQVGTVAPTSPAGTGVKTLAELKAAGQPLLTQH